MSSAERPLPLRLQGEAEEGPHSLAATTNGIYIFDLFAAVATVFEPRRELCRRPINLFLHYEPACAVLTKNAIDNLWSAAAKCDLAFWPERVPS